MGITPEVINKENNSQTTVIQLLNKILAQIPKHNNNKKFIYLI